MDRQIDR